MDSARVDVVPGYDRVFAKISRRLAPVFVLGYALASLDRMNIGFAQHKMQDDLGFDVAVYGTAASIFFVGYLLFEIPSNIVMQRVGARRALSTIMVGWGVLSSCTLFVRQPVELFGMRFLLGVFEAGLYPGLLLYITYWYPESERARVTALIQLGAVAAGLIAGPLSGFIIGYLDGTAGLAGWQWMFLLEGLPASAFGIGLALYLPNGPHDASWLDHSERDIVARALQSLDIEEAATRQSLRSLASKQVVALALIYFALISSVYAATFWMPLLLGTAGFVGPVQIGLAASIPYLIGGPVLIVASRHSDRTNERRWHFAISMTIAAVGFLLLASANGKWSMMLGLSLVIPATLVAATVFWPMVTAILSRRLAAIGIAVINAVGLIGGFVSPLALGRLNKSLGSVSIGMVTIAVLLLIAAAGLLALVKTPQSKNPQAKRST